MGFSPPWLELILGFLLGLSCTLALSLVFVAAYRRTHRVVGLGRRTQESLGVLETFYEHAPTLLGVVEVYGEEVRHIYDNPAACRFLGTLPGQTQGKSESELKVSKDQTALWLQKFQLSLAQRTPLRFEFKAREEQWLAVTVCPVIEEPGNGQQFCYLAEDISEWKNNAERSHLDRERLRIALEAGRLGFWDWNVLTGQVHYGGDWTRILGYPSDEFPPHISTWENLIHPDDSQRVMDVLRCNLKGDTSEYAAEYRLKSKSGSWLWVAARGRVIERSSSNQPIRHVGVLEDINERRNVREQLKLAARQKDEFLATLAHELRNPLAPIRTGLEIIKRSPSSPTAEQARDMMERQLVHLVRLIDDLLDISRISLGRLELKKSEITLKQIVDTAVEGSSPFIEANHHTLSVELPQEPIAIFGDLTRLAQVVSNLLNNSAKYTPNGGKIALRVVQHESTVVITVTDNGLGIPAEMLERIFDMFGQVNRTLDRAQGGLGIGLALVRKLVELHNGTVRAESAGQGLGSTFVVTLPITVQGASHPQEGISAQAVSTAAPRKVLVVDDNIDGAESLGMFLRLEGHSPRIAHTPSTALNIYEEFSPDLVFLDIGLPEMNGYEVARRMRASPSGAAVCLVAITGWGGEADKAQAQQAGFNAHLTKPVDLQAVRSLLEHGTGLTPFLG